MSMEEIVRQRHELEDRVNQFLEQISQCTTQVRTMETREIEICMAKLYDLMMQASEEKARLDHLFKGLLVKSVYDQRKAGAKQKNTFWSFPALATDIVNWRFEYPIPINETLANEWSNNWESTVRKLLTK